MIKPEEAKEYHIVTSGRKDSFEEEINKCLNDGWQLHGETIINFREDYAEFCQILIK